MKGPRVLNDFDSSFLMFELLMNAGTMLLYVGVYVLVSFATLAIFRKTGSALWKAWVPFVREWEMFRLSGMSPMWAIILPVGSMVVSVIGVVVMFATVFGVISQSGSADVGSLIALGVGAFLFSMGIIVAWCVFSLVVYIKMMNRINLGFKLSIAYTWLGVFVYPAWLAVVGWGSAQWQDFSGRRASLLRLPDGTGVALTARTVVIGSSGYSDGLPAGIQLITVQDGTGTVAPFHAQLDRIGDRWMVTDLQSPAGTYVIDGTGQAFRITQPMTGVSGLMLGHVRIDVTS